MLDPALACGSERIHMGLVIDCPSIPWSAGSRGKARDQGIEAFSAKALAKEGLRVCDIAEAQLGAVEESGADFRG